MALAHRSEDDAAAPLARRLLSVGGEIQAPLSSTTLAAKLYSIANKPGHSLGRGAPTRAADHDQAACPDALPTYSL